MCCTQKNAPMPLINAAYSLTGESRNFPCYLCFIIFSEIGGSHGTQGTTQVI